MAFTVSVAMLISALVHCGLAAWWGKKIEVSALRIDIPINLLVDDNNVSATYQEAVLARRKLCFSNVRVTFECEHCTSHEDECENEKALSDYDVYNKLMVPEETSTFDAYTRHVSNYGRRSLSFRSDTYAALTGIMNALFGLDSAYYGLPIAHFDRALRW
ncbi:hypothetical protein EK21DRAFT_112903 [Setomelanomma holmii]|uniref:Uncharacterized protein n=1 Tax=Setomelanomma holmii TaxID=210430 RepID=A0A9P4H7A0_9PLEO|nr:hypothetical protein EK21DRAFT_112903 [Setomelanomma holmii]